MGDPTHRFCYTSLLAGFVDPSVSFIRPRVKFGQGLAGLVDLPVRFAHPPVRLVDPPVRFVRRPAEP
jgi:hypothetical protein